jgi:hypothetical protein
MSRDSFSPWSFAFVPPSAAAAPAPVSPAEVYDPGRIPHLEIKMSRRDGIYCSQRGRPKGRRGNQSGTGKVAGVRLRPGSPGYAYVLASWNLMASVSRISGLRLKGNSSYAVSAETLRRPMRSDFDRFVEGARFAGIETV